MLREDYKALFADIKPSDKLINKVIKKRHNRVSIVVLVACMIVLTLPFTVFGLEPMDVLYNISPSLAQSLKPVMMSSVDQGIELRVISADIDEKVARVLIAFKDLEGSRLNKKFDTDDSYYIVGPFDSTGYMEFVEYVEETGESIYLVEIKAIQDQYLPRHKITFGLRTILTDPLVTSNEVILDELDKHEKARQLEEFYVCGRGGDIDPEKEDYIIESNMNMELNAPGVFLTGIGYLNDQLHIQLHIDDNKNLDNHGILKLLGDEELQAKTTLSFIYEDVNYDEFIFDISEKELSEYILVGDFFTYTDRIEGDWEVTFKLGD